ncbi:tetratricopeptide repeat protein [Bacteroidota bacterium]
MEKTKDTSCIKEYNLHSQVSLSRGWDKNKWLFLPVFLVIITFLSSLNFDFVSDDRLFFVKDSKLLTEPVKEYFENGYDQFSIVEVPNGQLYRPLVLLNFRLQFKFFGTNPMWFHFTNLLTHTIITVFIFFLFTFLIPTATGKSIALATSIFAIHPVQVETVCWIMGINQMMSTFWLIIGILLVFIARDRKRSYLNIIAVISFIAALLSKEDAYTFPGLLALLLLIRKESFSIKRIAILTVLSVITVIGVLLLRNNAVDTPKLIYSLTGVERAVNYLLGYIKMSLFPYPQRFYHTEPITGMVASWEIIIGLLMIACFCLLIWKYKTGRQFFILSAFSYLVILGPALAVSFHSTGPTFASRMVYFAIFPFALIVLWLLENSRKKIRQILEITFSLVIIIFMITSIVNGFKWKDQESFLKLAISSTPDYVQLYSDMGDYLIEQGETNKAIDWYIANVNSESIVEIKILAHERLGEIYAKNQYFEKARSEIIAALELDPKNSSTVNALGNITWLTGDLILAKAYYIEAIRLNPENEIAKRNLEAISNLIPQTINR